VLAIFLDLPIFGIEEAIANNIGNGPEILC
jgi:hypothetical protein